MSLTGCADALCEGHVVEIYENTVGNASVRLVHIRSRAGNRAPYEYRPRGRSFGGFDRTAYRAARDFARTLAAENECAIRNADAT